MTSDSADDSDASVRSKNLLDSSNTNDDSDDSSDDRREKSDTPDEDASVPPQELALETAAGNCTSRDAKPAQRRRKVEETDPLTMASSSSNNSDSENDDDTHYGYAKPIPDWNLLAGRSSGTTSLLRYLAVHEISSLVGWATHITHDGTTSSSAAAHQEPHNSNAPDRKCLLNPLLGVQPDAPLPPSHLNWIIQLAYQKMVPRRRAKKLKPSQLWDIPNDGCNDLTLMERLDHSALVALGVALEEMVTASLLPLAEMHVARCQQMEQQVVHTPAGHDPTAMNDEAFREWTLPPEEAIFNMISEARKSHDPLANVTTTKTEQELLHQKRQACVLPTACPPTRTIIPGHLFTPLNMPLLDPLRKTSANLWCRAQGRSPAFVRDNMDLYQFFLPVAPDDEPTGDEE